MAPLKPLSSFNESIKAFFNRSTQMGAELLHSSKHRRRTPMRKSSRNLRRRRAPICASPPIGEFYAGSGFASSAPAPSELPMPRLINTDRLGYRIGLPATDLVVDAFGRVKQEKESNRDFQIMEIWGRKRAAGLRVSDKV